MKAIVLARWLAMSAWWAIVIVTPELRRSAVLRVGMGHGPITVNGSIVFAGEPVKPGAVLGHTPLKSGQITAASRPLSDGRVMLRTYQSAPKNAPKNITSE